jgi:hypothetical protein
MFLYFTPGRVNSIPPELQYAFDSKSYSHCETVSGPLGTGQGMILAHPNTPAERVRLDPAKQTWRRIPNSELLCGIWNDTKPTPSSLQRDVLIDGHPIELEDGSRWQCAIARGFDADRESYYSPIPRSLELDESGRWLPSRFAPQYRRFMQLATEYAAANDQAVDSGESKFNFDGIDELAILGLTCNYRLSAIELALMPDAYSIRVRRQLLDAILDFPTIEAWTKKKLEAASVGSDSSDGPTQ